MMKSGGEIAQNLDDLYAYCLVRLLHANSKNDVQALDEIGSLFTPLLSAWTSIRNGGTGGSVEVLADVTRALKSVVPSVQRLYGANTYSRLSAMGA